jgi:uncharacterized protein (TIGR04376 family)
MGVLEDITRFLETRVEEFIRKNPQLELQLLDDQLRQQEEEILKLIVEYGKQEKQLQDQILAIAEDVRLWHERAKKAESAGMKDLQQGALEREASLLRQGNQVWAQMELAKQRLKQTQELQAQVKQRRKEVQAKIAQAHAQSSTTPNTTQTAFDWERFNASRFNQFDELDAKFRQWETEEELQRMKRKMGR